MSEFSPSTIAGIEAALGSPIDCKPGDHVKKVIDGQVKVFVGHSSYFQACRILIEGTIVEKEGQQTWNTHTEVL